MGGQKERRKKGWVEGRKELRMEKSERRDNSEDGRTDGLKDR